jgi:hypothetical protein
MKRMFVLAWVMFGCAGTQRVSPSVAAVDQMMSSPAARDVAREAPEAFAEASVAARRAREAQGDPVHGELRATEARLVFERAQSVAALAIARRRIEQAERSLQEVETEVSRIEQETEATLAECTRVEESRRAQSQSRQAVRAPSQVEQTQRANAAEGVRTQASLLLAAAVMLGATEVQASTVRDGIRASEQLTARGDPDAALLTAGRAYTAAERLLTAVREQTPPAEPTDAVTLARSLSANQGIEARRDARGVIAVMRGMFVGPRMAPTSRQRVELLSRVIREHASARVRVEVFVGGPVRAQADALARAQADALGAALRAQATASERVQTQGIYEPDHAGRRDDRVEVVLVLPSEP